MAAEVRDLPGFEVRGLWQFLRFDIVERIAAKVEHAEHRAEDGGGEE
jgi:hypothetical protein